MLTTASGEDPNNPIRGLRDLQEQRREIARSEEALVRRARLNGSSWQAIADALGVSKQAAHKRFGRA